MGKTIFSTGVIILPKFLNAIFGGGGANSDVWAAAHVTALGDVIKSLSINNIDIEMMAFIIF